MTDYHTTPQWVFGALAAAFPGCGVSTESIGAPGHTSGTAFVAIGGQCVELNWRDDGDWSSHEDAKFFRGDGLWRYGTSVAASPTDLRADIAESLRAKAGEILIAAAMHAHEYLDAANKLEALP